ncbi:hypothetical protein DL770_001922 [Monosporascus sp. CRB-9-2]|nr:hypothetical protein DL770_001922 [Monosporascus sp. CRB-9-2]
MTLLTDRFPRPPYDIEIEPLVKAAADNTESFVGDFDLKKLREEALRREHPRTQALLADKTVTCQDVVIPGPRNDLTLTVVRPAGEPSEPRPCIFYIHGGAMVRSDRYAGLDSSILWARELGAITISVEYGLAPENAGTEPAEDCYAALLWAGKNADALGIDADRLILYGVSAGGGLAASVALMIRDRKGGHPVALRGLFLTAPMLDDRAASVSAQQFVTGPMYNSTINRAAWRCLLGERAGSTADVVSAYEAPARAQDLSGLPPTYLDCGTAEPFRDDDAAFATKLWEGGVQAEFHAWPGAPHAFDRIAPDAAISKLAKATRLAWLRRILETEARGQSGQVTNGTVSQQTIE